MPRVAQWNPRPATCCWMTVKSRRRSRPLHGCGCIIADSVPHCDFCIRLRPWHRSCSLYFKDICTCNSGRQSTSPVKYTSVRSIAVTRLSRGPEHSLADEASVLLLQLSAWNSLPLHLRAAHHPLIEDHLDLG